MSIRLQLDTLRTTVLHRTYMSSYQLSVAKVRKITDIAKIFYVFLQFWTIIRY